MALIRLYRARLPAPEEISSQPAFTPHPAARRAVDGGGCRAMVWFRCNVGRHNNADPKWLLPLICRIGGVTKHDIGAIRIFDSETRFEIRADVVATFIAAINADTNLDMRMEPAGEAPKATAKHFGRSSKGSRFRKSPPPAKPTEKARSRTKKARKAG